jgi:hypothetical protein
VPKENNVHEVAQRAAPESRVVYVDRDPKSTLAYSAGQVRRSQEARVEGPADQVGEVSDLRAVRIA